ncbi:FtsX-like permease family protein [compost metagenome]
MALTLAAIGLYSLVAYDVAQHMQEISVRVALGAPRARVVRMVIGRGLALVGAGVVAGLVIAFLLAPRLQELMFNVNPLDPVIFAGVAAVLLVIGLVATAAPASRASRVDPALALRGD